MTQKDRGRPYDWRRYLLAFIITVLIFSLGLMLGFVIEGQRLNYVQQTAEQERLDFASLQLQYQYINYLKETNNCAEAIKSFQDNLNSLENTRIRLENYVQKSSIDTQEFSRLKREYIISQLNYWLFAKTTKDLCKRDEVTVLYIYSDQAQCPDCANQEFVLNYFRKLFQDKFLVFSFDTNYNEEPMVAILKRVYNVDTYPTIIIGDHVYKGFTDTQTILNDICAQYEGNYTECANAQKVVAGFEQYKNNQQTPLNASS
jgi:hypothetical protein